MSCTLRAAGLHSRGGWPPAARTLRCLTHEPTNERKTAQSKATQTKRRCPGMIRFNGVEGRRKMRNNDHETRFCGNVGGGGLRRRVYSRLCPRGLWARRRVCEAWRLRAQSYHSPGLTSAADARLPKPDSGSARGTYAAARHQRAGGAEPVRGSYVGRAARSVGLGSKPVMTPAGVGSGELKQTTYR